MTVSSIKDTKRKANSWIVWSLGWILMLLVVFGTLNFLDVLGTRVVFSNSFQYSEARKSAIATYEAELQEINKLLASGVIDEITRSNLEAQAAGLRIRIKTEGSK